MQYEANNMKTREYRQGGMDQAHAIPTNEMQLS
jgi:hypothetical protein